VDEDPKGIEVSEGCDGFGSCETHHVGIRPEEDRGGATGTVGEGKGGSEEGGLGPKKSRAFN
jgi:hypothetical protein